MSKIAYRPVRFAPPSVTIDDVGDGALILRSPQSLQPYQSNVGQYLIHWAEQAPDRVFLAERTRDGKGWREYTYAQAFRAVQSIAQALLSQGLSIARPVVILSENSVDHALLGLAAMYVAIPYSPISTAYSLMSDDLAKLKHILGTLQPGLIYASDGARYGRALKTLDLKGATVVIGENPPEGLESLSFQSLLDTTPTATVAAAHGAVGPNSIGKILFTSGSTDLPKGVINTQRMMCSNQKAIAQLWPFLTEHPPIVVDWLPWNHTFGGNHNFHMVLANGGTLYIDNGKPVPGSVEKTVANIRDVAPTMHFNVPRGLDMLIPHLERDEDFRSAFFRNLDVLFYAGAALPQNIWTRLDELSVAATGQRVRIVSSWGSTETAPMITLVHYEMDRAGIIGLPGPGTELKLIPNGGKLELRVRGPGITTGYFKRDDLTAKAFDADGFYITGDAGRFADPNNPAKGIQFDGRIAEDFKLMTGVWVHVGALRVASISALAPVAQDIVISGHDREEVGILIFASPDGCKTLCPGLPDDTPLSELIKRPELRQYLSVALKAFAAHQQGSSSRVTRALLMAEPPAIDANEITDKGYINQRAVLTHRASLVQKLFSDHPDVITL